MGSKLFLASSSDKKEKPTQDSLRPNSTSASVSLRSSSHKYKLSTPFERVLTEVSSFERVKSVQRSVDHHIKIVVVGDGAVGKTCLLISYTQGRFPQEYVPTVFENYVTKVKGPAGKVIELALWDTAGQEEYNRLRPLSYTDVDLLMVCYAANSKTSLQNVEELWIPEVCHFCPDTPIMLIGTKSDLYALDQIDKLVNPTEAETLAQKVGAIAHFQSSAKLHHNIDEIFGEAMKAVLRTSVQGPKKFSPFSKTKKGDSDSAKRRKHRCSIL
ncbi:LAME_0G05160g1_1 [Lachancea meyersii CBS 8951]|uniref:GTP-binding protein RHO4 n=1 Tax=Lachancea meyersii CBS 8951 TaxID=1266667 RepID=A0A1G4K744_9SACH|nr:LAME_0G05160g1_1 [Lachancea meyersii CBS 8951]